MLSLGCGDLLCCFLKYSWFSLVECGALSLGAGSAQAGVCPQGSAQDQQYAVLRWSGVWLCFSWDAELQILPGCMCMGVAGPSFGSRWGSPLLVAAAVGSVGWC